MALKSSKEAYREQRIERSAKAAYKAVQRHQGNSVRWQYAHPDVQAAYRVAAEAVLIYENLIVPDE